MRLFPVLLLTALLAWLAAPGAEAQQRPEEFVYDADGPTLTAIRAEYGRDFRIFETDHFRVISDTSTRHHMVVTGQLEQFYQIVQPQLFVSDIPTTDVVLVDDGRDYEALIRARDLPTRSGYGLYDPNTRTIYVRLRQADGQESGVGPLFHMAMKVMLDADFSRGSLPRWIEKGFASLFEVGRIIGGQWVYGNPNPSWETSFRVAYEQGRVPSLMSLLSTPDSAFAVSAEQTNLIQNSGRSLFLYLLRFYEGDAIVRFIDLLRSGAGPATALADVTGLELPEIEEAWRDCIENFNFGGDYLYRGVHSVGLSLLEEGARLYPHYGNLQLALANEYLNRGRLDLAEKHARMALADRHLSFRQQANYVLGTSLIETDMQEAMQAYQMTIALQPWSERVLETPYRVLIKIFEATGEWERALALRKELDEILALDAQ